MLTCDTKPVTGSDTAEPMIQIHATEQFYGFAHNVSSDKLRREQIEQYRAQIPKLYRGIYDKAISGRSRKAAMHSFCVECCGYQIAEVYNCTDLACPLYPYRPKSRVSPVAPQGVRERAGAKKSSTGGLWAGI